MNRIVSIVILFLLISCSSSAPGDVAKSFFENMAHGKIKEAKKYATESTGKMLDFAMYSGNSIPIEPDFSVEIIKDSIVRKKAWVTFEAQNGVEQIVELFKIDGKWLVHFVNVRSNSKFKASEEFLKLEKEHILGNLISLEEKYDAVIAQDNSMTEELTIERDRIIAFKDSVHNLKNNNWSIIRRYRGEIAELEKTCERLVSIDSKK